ncbi:hypothetical protein AWM70_10895 [Paenibacillus yonginensis]|uniref:Spore coat protein D n=1 Tax=Paenibacillus yonginensis TaxID=1462996 RepID=A0A1B1N0T7_9BACL|nr:hypothetical protein [Paenibacillus yonginensis]ANS75047.1 hypothetical protein AWM70_10895 [Paenibacillus yonginensis]
MNKFCCPPASPIVLDPIVSVQNFYHPQVVPVIQPIEVVQKHHCVPVYQQCYTYNTTEVGPEYGHEPGHGLVGPRAGISKSKSRGTKNRKKK